MNRQPLTAAQANAVYDILVEHAGASDHPHSFARADFILSLSEQNVTEYRFMGSLGCGGKFWNDRGWRVTAYPEDMTPERKQAIDATNRALAALDKQETM